MRDNYVRSGMMPLNTGYLGFSGRLGYNWSAMPYVSYDYAYYLTFNAVGVMPSYLESGGRYLSLPLRCLAD